MKLFGKNRLGYEITAEDKSKPAVESAQGGIRSLEKVLSEVAKNTKATEAATTELSQSIKGLGQNSSSAFQELSGAASRHFGLVASAITRVGIGLGVFRSATGAALAVAGKAFLGIGAAIASANIAEGFVETAEAAKRTEAQLKLVTGEGREFADVQKAIYQSSQSLGQPLNQSIELYTSLGRGLKAAGHDYQTVLQLTNAVGLALKAGSVDAVSAAQGIRQLSQAFGAGALRGDEFTSVLENFPRLAQAIADGLGVPIGKLRGMAEQGLLTTTKILDAVTSQQAKLAEEAAKIPLTIDQAFTKLTSSIGLYVADIDKAIGVTSKLAGAVDLLASAFTRADDDLDGAIKRIDKATGDFETFKLEINAVGTALDNVGVGDSAFLEFVSNISSAMSDASDKFKLFRKLMSTVTAPANMALRIFDLAKGTPEERRRRGNQVPGASSAPLFASMDDDSLMRQAQNRLENYDKLQEAEENAQKAAERSANAENRRAEASQKRGDSEARRSEENLKAIRREEIAEEKALQNKLDRIDEERITERDALKDRIDGLRAAISTELELEEIKYQERLNLLKEAQLSEHAEILGGAEEVSKLKLRIEEDHARNIQEIHDQANEELQRQADAANADLERQQEENSRLIEQPFLNAIDGIQGGFTDAFRDIFSGGVNTFSDFADTVKNIFINLAAEIASLLVFNVALGGIFGGGGGAASLLGGGASLLGSGGGIGAAGSVLGAGGGSGGGFMGLLSMGASKLSGAFSGLTSGINSFGQSIGFGGSGATFSGVGPLSSFGNTAGFTPASLSSVLGAAGLSSLGGGLISSAFGGNTTVGSVAGGALGAGGYALGATYGSSFGPIGAAIGAILGGILGGLIKETPPRGFQISTVGGGVSSQGGKKGFDPGTLTPISGGIGQAILVAGKALGINKKDLDAIQFWIGYSKDGGFNTSARFPGGQSNFGDDINALQTEVYEQELTNFALRFKKEGDRLRHRALKESFKQDTLAGAVAVVNAYIQLKKEIDKAAGEDAEGLRFGSRVLNRALRKKNVEKAAASADADIAFREKFEQITGEVSPLKSELEALRREFMQLRTTARALGLDLADLNEVEKERAKELIEEELGITLGTAKSRLEDGLKQLQEGFVSLRSQAKTLGISIGEVNELEKERIRSFLSEQLGVDLGTAEDRLETQLEELGSAFDVLRDHAKELGLTVGEVNKLEKQRTAALIAGQLTTAISQIQALQQQTGITGIQNFLQQQQTSEVLAPEVRLEAALAEFKRLRDAAHKGDLAAAQAIPAAASALLEIAREVGASGPAFASLFTYVNRQLKNLQDRQEKIFKFPNIEGAIKDASKEQVRAIKEQTAKLAEEIVLLRRELRRAA